MATRPTIDARRSAKTAFKNVVRIKFIGDRGAGYAWLAAELGVSEAACHFAMMSAQQALSAEAACRALLKVDPNV